MTLKLHFEAPEWASSKQESNCGNTCRSTAPLGNGWQHASLDTQRELRGGCEGVGAYTAIKLYSLVSPPKLPAP